MTVVYRKCSLHPERQAAARCPNCRNFFCHECVTEHEGRVLCATCLEQRTGQKTEGGSGSVLAGLLQITAGLITAWLFFYLLARFILVLTEPDPQDLPF